ncbi:hypothetical protein [Kineococcus sp. SYSU DK003]|uniref:hypothetical protein n=1 Tax=Kineococcus sp. SYSU DK003 TaxID=3383124 RepID=UPI003D7DC71F
MHRTLVSAVRVPRPDAPLRRDVASVDLTRPAPGAPPVSPALQEWAVGVLRTLPGVHVDVRTVDATLRLGQDAAGGDELAGDLLAAGVAVVPDGDHVVLSTQVPPELLVAGVHRIATALAVSVVAS